MSLTLMNTIQLRSLFPTFVLTSPLPVYLFVLFLVPRRTFLWLSSLSQETHPSRKGDFYFYATKRLLSPCAEPPLQSVIWSLTCFLAISQLAYQALTANQHVFTANPKWTGPICLLLTLPVTHFTFIFEYKSIHSFNLSSSYKYVWAQCLCHAIPPT